MIIEWLLVKRVCRYIVDFKFYLLDACGVIVVGISFICHSMLTWVTLDLAEAPKTVQVDEEM